MTVTKSPESLSYWASYQQKQDAKVKSALIPVRPETKPTTLKLNKLVDKFNNK